MVEVYLSSNGIPYKELELHQSSHANENCIVFILVKLTNGQYPQLYLWLLI
jgi:hypothetical protein